MTKLKIVLFWVGVETKIMVVQFFFALSCVSGFWGSSFCQKLLFLPSFLFSEKFLPAPIFWIWKKEQTGKTVQTQRKRKQSLL